MNFRHLRLILAEEGLLSPRERTAAAKVNPVRQRTQFSCMTASATMALRALGYDCDEDTVNKVMGAAPMKGAAWEQALATFQHYGCRSTLTTPSTVAQLKAWTDAGTPVMIAWNPEGREWSHASLVYDVKEDPEHGFLVYVADPNIPDPDETVRIVPKKDFYAKWYEKWPNYLVRRPALAIEREITPEGRQVMASRVRAGGFDWRAFGSDLRAAFAKTKVPARVVTGEEFVPQKIVQIDVQFGRDYFERPGWDDDKASDLIHTVSLKHGLKAIGFPGDKYSTPDGWTVQVGIMASSSGGSPERLASRVDRGWEGVPNGNRGYREYYSPELVPLGNMWVDRGRVNWRPNVLQAPYPKAQILFEEDYRTTLREFAPRADGWVRKHYGDRVLLNPRFSL